MKLNKGLLIALVTLILASLMLAACATPAPAVVEEEPAEAPAEESVEEPAEEPMEEEPAAEAEEPMEEEMAEADLDTPVTSFLASMEAYNTISPQAVSEQMIDGTEIFLVDVRQPEELETNGYIEGAINIPLRELGKNIDKLPAMDSYVVTYCGSGWRSTLAMTALGELGFTNVKTMVGGSFSGWVEAGYPVVEGMPEAPAALSEASPDAAVLAEVDAALSGLPEGWGVLTPEGLNEELVEGKELVIVDVRKQAELDDYGYIEGSTLITLEQMVEMQDMWPEDKDAEIVTYCKAGTRGNIAAMILRTYGYTNVRNVKGGFTAWTEAGLPVVGGYSLEDGVAAFLANMESYNTITPQSVFEQQTDGTEIFLVDVRQPEELEANGYIEGAINIPLRELGKNVDKLPALDSYVVTYCGSGWRSTIAMTALGELGFTNVKTMVGGSFGGWVEAGFPVVEGMPEAPAVLGEASPNAAAVAKVDAAMSGLPEGWGVLTPEGLNEELVEGKELVIIDVRRPEEVEENGYIEGAVFVPLEQMVELMANWPAKDAEIVTYCKAGTRGNIAATILRTFGYTNVRNLKGGFDGWVAAGLPAVAE